MYLKPGFRSPKLLILVLAFLCMPAWAQGNGKLQLHFIDVDQGDGALLISPMGETVLFDNGDRNSCSKPVEYLRSLGITKIDYMIVSHYHSDHFGCTQEVLAEFPLQVYSYDRPGAYNSGSFTKYVNAVGNKRKHVYRTTKIILDKESTAPVRINIAGYNGAGVNTQNENDRSVVAVIHFQQFNVVMAGDLSGYKGSDYKDIETVVARKLGQMEVYKVNHHGSQYSSNSKWMQTISPRIAIVSAGDPNTHGHPRELALKRIQDAGTEKIYWTSRGQGDPPVEGRDIVANGSILIEVAQDASTFSVKYGTTTDIYPVWPTPYTGKR